MTQALAHGFSASSENGSDPSQAFGLDASFNVGQGSQPQGGQPGGMLDNSECQPATSVSNGVASLRHNGSPHGQPAQQPEHEGASRPGNTDYDNFLAITGLGVKLPAQTSDAAARLGLGTDLKGQPHQGIPPSLQEFLSGMARPTGASQVLNLHSHQPQPATSTMQTPPQSSQEHQKNSGDMQSMMGAQTAANGHHQSTQPEHAAAPPDAALKPQEERKESTPPAPASDIQQLLFNISMPQMNGFSGSDSHNAFPILNNGTPTANATSIADVLAAVQPQPQAATVPLKTELGATDPQNAQAQLPAASSDAAAEPAGSSGDGPASQLSLQTGVSAFAAVADSPLDEDASKAPAAASAAPAQPDAPVATQALPPPQIRPGGIGGPQLAQNLFDPPVPKVGSSSSFSAEAPPVRPPSVQDGLLSRLPNPEHAALLQQLQQFAPEASNEDLLRALQTHIVQQAQQRASATQAAQTGPLVASGPLGAGLSLPSAGYPGAGMNDPLRQSGMLTRGGLPQQLNRSLYPGQVSGQMGGQMGGQLGGRATPPAGLQPPFQGLAERALAGMESYSNAQPKPQAATQQMRFGGNIGVHAINRTSAAPMNPSQQLLQQPGALGMPGMGGLGAMAGLGSALDGLPGAPRPGVRPPNWQRAQALAQQAAQAQAQQQAAIKMAAARAEAQRQAQLQAAQQQNRQNFLAGLTPAQVQLLMNAPAHQVNALAAQLGMMDTSARPGANLGAQAPGLAANQALLRQQKLAAARANFASQQAQQRGAEGAMLGMQAQQPPLLGLQQARQGGRNMPGAVNAPGFLGAGSNPMAAAQPPQVGNQAAATPRTNVVDMGRYLAQNGISVEQAVNSGILGGFSAFDVRALSEGHHQELQRLRNARAQQAAQASAVSQQQQAHAAQQQQQAHAQQQQQQQLLQQQLLRQSQLQQLQQAQAAQAAQAAQLQPLDSQLHGQNGSDAGSQLNTPNSTSVMNLGPGSLGQLFDWGAGQGQQPGLAGAAPQGGSLNPSNMRLLGGQMGSMLQSHLSGSSNAPGALGTGLTGSNSARNLSEAMTDPNLTLHGLRSRSPWEGGPVASVQPQSAHSSHVNTPRSARPGTMGSLLDVPNAGFGAIGHPAAPKYPSQGSLDGELPGYLKPASGAQAPIGRASRTSQTEVPSSVRAFWETGSSNPGGLASNLGMNSARAPDFETNTSGNAMVPALDLEAIDAALEAQSNLGTGQPEQLAPASYRTAGSAGQESITTPQDLNSFDSGNYSFFQQAALADAAAELQALSLESEIEDRAGIGSLLDENLA